MPNSELNRRHYLVTRRRRRKETVRDSADDTDTDTDSDAACCAKSKFCVMHDANRVR